MDKIVLALEEWDSIIDYWRPNGHSKTWYLKEDGKISIPKMWGKWDIVDVEDGDKMHNHQMLREITTLYFDSEYTEYLHHENIPIKTKKYFYIINITNSSFFETNKDVGLSCVSNHYLNDMKSGRCELVFVMRYEGYSGMEGNRDFEILNKWIVENGLDPKKVHYICGNLIINDILKKKKLEYNGYGISDFQTWINQELYYQYPNNVEYSKDNRSNKLFLSYNRLPREHRIKLFLSLYTHNLLEEGYISMDKFPLDEHIKEQNVRESVDNILPLKLSSDININLATKIDIEDFENTFISLVTETLHQNDTIFFSEKIWKPISLGHPFILLGNPHSLQMLQNMGYLTFNQWIDESYDKETNLDKRISLIIKEIHKLKQMNQEQLYKLRNEMNDILTYNRKKFRESLLKHYEDSNFEINNQQKILNILKSLYKK